MHGEVQLRVPPDTIALVLEIDVDPQNLLFIERNSPMIHSAAGLVLNDNELQREKGDRYFREVISEGVLNFMQACRLGNSHGGLDELP